jgi:hypothetical protein
MKPNAPGSANSSPAHTAGKSLTKGLQPFVLVSVIICCSGAAKDPSAVIGDIEPLAQTDELTWQLCGWFCRTNGSFRSGKQL